MTQTVATQSRLICAAPMIALCASHVAAQPAYPSKPVRFFVGAPAGGSNDIFARAIGVSSPKRSSFMPAMPAIAKWSKVIKAANIKPE